LGSTRYNSTRTLLAVDNKVIRIGLREAFKHSGFRAFTEVAEQGALVQALNTASFDLIIASAELGGFSAAPIISAMRNGRMPHHPFPIVIMLLAESDQDFVRKISNAGPDHMMLLPVAPGPMLKRIDDFALSRRPFVVTLDYTGPDRRKGLRPGCEEIPLVDVPNPLRASTRNIPDEIRQSEIELTEIHLHALRLGRYSVQLRWIDNTIRAMLTNIEANFGKIVSFARTMKRIAADMPSDDTTLSDDMALRLENVLDDLDSGADAILLGGPTIDRQRLIGILATCRDAASAIEDLIDLPSAPRPRRGGTPMPGHGDGLMGMTLPHC
jgi:DNA-binding response OmpR family regulator